MNAPAFELVGVGILVIGFLLLGVIILLAFIAFSIKEILIRITKK